jgi:hypothetical protein
MSTSETELYEGDMMDDGAVNKQHPNYKTVLCFHDHNGDCKHGDGCNFVHKKDPNYKEAVAEYYRRNSRGAAHKKKTSHAHHFQGGRRPHPSAEDQRGASMPQQKPPAEVQRGTSVPPAVEASFTSILEKMSTMLIRPDLGPVFGDKTQAIKALDVLIPIAQVMDAINKCATKQ